MHENHLSERSRETTLSCRDHRRANKSRFVLHRHVHFRCEPACMCPWVGPTALHSHLTNAKWGGSHPSQDLDLPQARYVGGGGVVVVGVGGFRICSHFRWIWRVVNSTFAFFDSFSIQIWRANKDLHVRIKFDHHMIRWKTRENRHLESSRIDLNLKIWKQVPPPTGPSSGQGCHACGLAWKPWGGIVASPSNNFAKFCDGIFFGMEG